MNKKLLTLAVAGAIVGGMGVAQADVTVYGKAHVSIDRENTPGTADNTVVSNNSTRLGVKFSDDVGGGLKGIGQYEVTVGGLDEGGTLFTSARNSFVGLSSDSLGTVFAGRNDTPLKIIGRAIELFPEQVGDARNITSPSDSGSWDLRPTNVVAYTTPTWAGVSAMVLWSADNGTASTATDNNQASVASASVSYKGGPVYVAAAYEKHDSVWAGGSEDETAFRVAASGTFGIFKVVGLYQQSADEAGVSGADRSVYGIGGSVTLAEKHVIKTQVYVADAMDNSGVNEDGATMVALGYDYKFSKKTTGYVAYAKTSNDVAGAYHVSDSTSNRSGHGESLTLTAGNDVQAASIGVIMDF